MNLLDLKLAFLFCLPVFGFGQTADTVFLEQKFEIPVSARSAVADNLGQVYVVSDENTFEKYGSDGRLLARYSQNRLGRAAFADVSNPLKISLFYPDFRTVVFLDRNLAELGVLDLGAVGLPVVSCLAVARDGNLWVYDEVNFQLKKTGPAGQVLAESQPMNFLPAQPVRPVLISENENSVFLCDGETGVFQFDVYGQFVRVVPGLQVFPPAVFKSGRVLFFDKNILLDVDLQTGERRTGTCFSKTLPLLEGWSASGTAILQITDERVYVFRLD